MTVHPGRPGRPGHPGLSNSLLTRHHRGPWSSLPSLELPPVAAVLARSQAEALRAVRAHAEAGAETLIVAAGRIDEAQRAELLGDGFAVVDGPDLTGPPAPRRPEPGRLWLLTSGSTGRPKRVGHTLSSLTTVAGSQPARRWLCAYSPGTYAWWQLVTLCLEHPRQDLVCVENDEVDAWPDIARKELVTAVSGTPTFWRQALWRSGPVLRDVPLEQITLGGEPVDQAVLDQLREVYPTARISWIYASSEAGAAIAVHDGRAGFPVEWLERVAAGRPVLRVERDELLISSPHHADGIEGVIRTGDRVEVADGRVLIVGRIGSDEINVGGSKVSASAVRDVLQSHPAVAWAGVKGRKAPIVGTMVTAEVVLHTSAPEAELAAYCRERLPDYAVPRRFRFLDAIPLKETLKSDV